MRVPCKCEERTCGHSHRVHASFFSQYFELVSCSVWIFRLSAAAVAQWNVLCGFTPTLTVLFLPVRYFLLGFSLLFPLAYGFCTQVYCKFLYRIRLTLPSPVHSNLSLRSHNKTSFFFFLHWIGWLARPDVQKILLKDEVTGWNQFRDPIKRPSNCVVWWTELRGCVKVEVTILGSQSRISNSPYGLCGHKTTLNLLFNQSSGEAVWKSRRLSWAPCPKYSNSPYGLCRCSFVKQHWNWTCLMIWQTHNQ